MSECAGCSRCNAKEARLSQQGLPIAVVNNRVSIFAEIRRIAAILIPPAGSF